MITLCSGSCTRYHIVVLKTTHIGHIQDNCPDYCIIALCLRFVWLIFSLQHLFSCFLTCTIFFLMSTLLSFSFVENFLFLQSFKCFVNSTECSILEHNSFKVVCQLCFIRIMKSFNLEMSLRFEHFNDSFQFPYYWEVFFLSTIWKWNCS